MCLTFSAIYNRYEKYFYSDHFKIKFYISISIINFNKKEKEFINKCFWMFKELIILVLNIYKNINKNRKICKNKRVESIRSRNNKL